MEFGSCSTNSGIKFISITDIDQSVIRVAFKDYDEPVSTLIKYYMDTSKPAKEVEDMKIAFKNN
jgi:hypothetical protein